MTAGDAPKARPYWHVDAKWVTGLLLVFFLNWMLLTINLVQLTSENRAIDTGSTAMARSMVEASGFSPCSPARRMAHLNGHLASWR